MDGDQLAGFPQTQAFGVTDSNDEELNDRQSFPQTQAFGQPDGNDEQSDDAAGLGDRRGFPETQAFGLNDDSNQNSDEDEELGNRRAFPETQAFDENSDQEEVEDQPGLSSTQAFDVKDANENVDDEELGSDERDFPQTQAIGENRSDENSHVENQQGFSETQKFGEENDSDGEELDDQKNEEDQKSEVGELIADIFGESDEEGGNEIVQNEDAADVDQDEQSEDGGLEEFVGPEDDNETDRKRETESDFVSDFDLMMQKRKQENSKRRRKRKDYDVINDSDDMINELLHQMKRACKEDIELNSQKLPALKKRKLLPVILKELKKSDLQSSFIEMGAVTILAEWLSPLPDKSLPALEIRTEFLKVLQQFPTFDHQVLRSSNIGKAVMILYKHPKETKENKERAGKLISEWARPIFNLQSDYRSLTKDERIKRDYDHMPLAKKRRMSSLDSENPPPPAKSNAPEEKQLGPGDKGFIIRARVPRPSTRDYVVRPKWNIETQFRKNSKKAVSQMDRKIREIKERTKPKKLAHAIGVSIEGRKLAL